MTVLVTGGAGYVGAPVVHKLLNQNVDVVVLDNLSQGDPSNINQATLVDGDVRNQSDLTRVFDRYDPSLVYHFAAKALVGESVRNPEKYYEHNVRGTLNLLRSMREHNTSRFIFSSTAAVYGMPDQVPIPETHPCDPINPYGRTKRTIEELLQDYREAYGLGYVIFRYFNAAGAIPEWNLGEDHDPETHLIPNILTSIENDDLTFSIFGTDYPTRDGTCIRDFVHIRDLADVHVKALDHLEEGEGQIYNVGTGTGRSVREVVECVQDVVDPSFEARESDPRPGDPPALVADPSKLRDSWNWGTKHSSLPNIIRTAAKWHLEDR